MLRRIVLATACVACLAPAALAGSNVKGTLWLSSTARTRASRAAAPPRQTGVNEAVVWVEAIPEQLEARLAAPRIGWLRRRPAPRAFPTVAQRGEAFTPRVTAVAAGGSVEFSNRDQFYHSAFSVSGAKRFDLGKRAPGRLDTLVFERAGVVNLHCEIHPDAVGFVVVTPNHAYTVPDSTGRFVLPRLPAGRYVLRAWHPRRGELKLPFAVPRRGTVALDPAF